MGSASRRRPTLEQRLNADEEEAEGKFGDNRRCRKETVTLATVLAGEKRGELSVPSASTSTVDAAPFRRTLLDIIHEEDGGDSGNIVRRTHHHSQQSHSQRIFWKAFKHRIRLRRVTAAGWCSSASPSSIVTITHNSDTHLTNHPSGDDLPQQQPRAEEDEIEEPIRVSLMALLDETCTLENSLPESPQSPLLEDLVGEKGDVGQWRLCCVCMDRRKSSAFIPCGHTFCRLCSRELWVGRGICPLCNGFILDILDIF